MRVDATLLIISMLCDGISFHFLIRTETRVCPAWHQKIVFALRPYSCMCVFFLARIITFVQVLVNFIKSVVNCEFCVLKDFWLELLFILKFRGFNSLTFYSSNINHFHILCTGSSKPSCCHNLRSLSS